MIPPKQTYISTTIYTFLLCEERGQNISSLFDRAGRKFAHQSNQSPLLVSSFFSCFVCQVAFFLMCSNPIQLL